MHMWELRSASSSLRCRAWCLAGRDSYHSVAADDLVSPLSERPVRAVERCSISNVAQATSLPPSVSEFNPRSR